MRKAAIYQHGELAGTLEEITADSFRFIYSPGYQGEPVSLTMPIRQAPYEFNQFPPVFEGLLPEGIMLEAMLRREKIDKKDLFKQLVTIGEDVVGSLRIEEIL